MTFQQNSFRPITLWFEVEFYNYFTGMIPILRQRVVCNIWVATLKAKVTAWPCSKILSAPKLCYLKSDFTTTFDKLLLCVQYLFGEHYPVPTGSCLNILHATFFNSCWICLYFFKGHTIWVFKVDFRYKLAISFIGIFVLMHRWLYFNLLNKNNPVEVSNLKKKIFFWHDLLPV